MLLWVFAACDSADTLAHGHESMLARLLGTGDVSCYGHEGFSETGLQNYTELANWKITIFIDWVFFSMNFDWAMFKFANCERVRVMGLKYR